MKNTTKYNTNDPEAVEIREKIEYLASIHKDLKINDVISVDEVRKFEAEHQIRLPDDYVWFITNVGNGGTWQPFNGAEWIYSFYPLEETYFSDERVYADMRADDEDYERGESNFSLDVFSIGCSYSMGIILQGEHYGEISSNGEGEAIYHPLMVHGFKEFYLKWLYEECQGYDISGFENRLYGTIEEHLEQYKAQHELRQLSNIFSKVNKRCATEGFISELYDVFCSETENEHKVLLAQTLIKSGYEDVFSVLNEIFSIENYEDVIWELHKSLKYFSNWLKADGVMNDAEKYYPMLVKAMKYYETAEERNYFKYCFPMTVMNPRFNEKDIIGILTSDDPEIIKYMAFVYEENILNRVGKYIKEAKKKYAQIKAKF